MIRLPVITTTGPWSSSRIVRLLVTGLAVDGTGRKRLALAGGRSLRWNRYAASYSEANTLRYSVRIYKLGSARRGARDTFVGTTFSIARSANELAIFRNCLDCLTAIRLLFHSKPCCPGVPDDASGALYIHSRSGADSVQSYLAE